MIEPRDTITSGSGPQVADISHALQRQLRWRTIDHVWQRFLLESLRAKHYHDPKLQQRGTSWLHELTIWLFRRPPRRPGGYPHWEDFFI